MYFQRLIANNIRIQIRDNKSNKHYITTFSDSVLEILKQYVIHYSAINPINPIPLNPIP